MEITKETLNKMRDDSSMKFMAKLFGLDLNELINDAEKQMEEESKKKVEEEAVKNYRTANCHFYTEDEIKEICRNLLKDHDVTNEPKSVDDSEYVSTSTLEASGKSFLMPELGLENFVKEYTELENIFHKLKYTYGIDFNCGGNTGDTIYTRVNEIIWKLLRVIFGDDNADTIADYVFGNSEYNTVKEMYEDFE